MRCVFYKCGCELIVEKMTQTAGPRGRVQCTSHNGTSQMK